MFPISLTGLARGFGSLAVAAPGRSERAVADAMRAHPEMVAGTGELDTLLMAAVPGLVAKRGADGVHTLALPDGTGIAVKIADGALRAHLPVLLGALGHLGVDIDPDRDLAGLQARYSATLTGGGRPVGSIDLAPDLARLLSADTADPRYWMSVHLPCPMAAVN
jgi:L-asparaginase II